MPPGRTIGNGSGRLGNVWGEVRGLNGVIIVEPSQHELATGRYRWQRTGAVPELPVELADLLDDGTPGEDAAHDAQVAAFIAEHTAATRPSIIAGLVNTLATNYETKSRHTSTIAAVVGAMKEAGAGYYPAQLVIDTIKPMFITAATRRTTRRGPQ